MIKGKKEEMFLESTNVLEQIIHHICRLYFHYCRDQETAHRWGTHRILSRDGGKQ